MRRLGILGVSVVSVLTTAVAASAAEPDAGGPPTSVTSTSTSTPVSATSTTLATSNAPTTTSATSTTPTSSSSSTTTSSTTTTTTATTTTSAAGATATTSAGASTTTAPADAAPPAGATLEAAGNPVAHECNPVRVSACALPWPSDLFAARDPRTATGQRLVVGDGVIPEAVLAELPPSSRPSAVYTGHDGFSPLGPILFEVDRAPDPASLPADGGATLRVFDVTAGVEVPIRAEISEEAARRGGHVVVAWPRTRFEFGHRYVAALTDRLVPLGGGAYRPSPGFAEAIRGGLSPLGLRYGLLRLYLAWRGIRAADLVSATYFTVRSEADATDPLRSMAATAYARPHPVRDVRALPNLFGIFGASVSTIVVGEVQVTDFRDARGEIHHRAGDQGTPRWLDFLLTVPRSAAHRPAPVAVYGHGITMVKETMIVVTEANAARGVATIAIDQPNHGSRAASEGGLIQELARPEHVGRLQSIIIQSSIDQVSVLRAVETSLADLDVVNPRPWSVGVPDGRADLDPGRVLYEGTSMGGVLGSAFTAVAPTVEGSAFQVTGAGIMNILTHSRVWEDLAPGVGFRDAVPQTANGAEALALVAGLQFAIDGGDGLTVAHRYRRPYPATGAKSVLVLYGVGDGVVFNPSSEALAAVAGLPLLERSVYPIPGLPVVPELPADGSAVYQIDTSGIPGPLRPSLAHISFLGREPMRVLGEWLDHVLEAGG